MRNTWLRCFTARASQGSWSPAPLRPVLDALRRAVGDVQLDAVDARVADLEMQASAAARPGIGREPEAQPERRVRVAEVDGILRASGTKRVACSGRRTSSSAQLAGRILEHFDVGARRRPGRAAPGSGTVGVGPRDRGAKVQQRRKAISARQSDGGDHSRSRACVKMRASMRRHPDRASPAVPRCCVPASARRPQPKPNEILVKVAAAGVNRPDVLQRMGTVRGAARRIRPAGPGDRGRGRRLRRGSEDVEGRRQGLRARRTAAATPSTA